MARINAGSGLVGALLGATVALVVALTQLSAQDKQLDRLAQQDQATFLRDNRLDAYSDALTAFATLNNGLADMAHAGSVDAQLAHAKQLLNEARHVREVSSRTQLLSPPAINEATRELNASYLTYLRILTEDLRSHVRRGGSRTDPPPALSEEQTSALDQKGTRYEEWLSLVRASLQGATT